jgi:hypothetical protein
MTTRERLEPVGHTSTVGNLGEKKPRGLQKGCTHTEHSGGIVQVLKDIPDDNPFEPAGRSKLPDIDLMHGDSQNAATDLREHPAVINALSVETVVPRNTDEFARATPDVENPIAISKIPFHKLSLEVGDHPASTSTLLPCTVGPVVIHGQIGECLVLIDVK